MSGGGDALAQAERALADALVDAAMLWCAGQGTAAPPWGLAAVERFVREPSHRLFRSALSMVRATMEVPDDGDRLAAYEALSPDERERRLAALRPQLGTLLDRVSRGRIVGAAALTEPVAYQPEPLGSPSSAAASPPASVPATPRPAYRRDLQSDAALARERDRMALVLTRFEAARAVSRADEGDDPSVNAVDWCLDDATEYGLSLSVGPFPVHPPLPPTLTLVRATELFSVPTVGLRRAAVAVPVKPAREALHWGVEGLDEAVRAWLSTQPPPWLSDREVTLFEGGTGPGRRLVARTLTRGERYRVLVPRVREAAVRAVVGDGARWTTAGDEWWHVAFTLAAAGSAVETAAWEALGFEVREPAMQVRLATLGSMGAVGGAGVLAMARVHDDESVVVSVRGAATSERGAAQVLVSGGGQWAAHPLEPGAQWQVPLGRFSPGRYVVRATHERSTVPHGDLLVEVIARGARGAVSVHVGGETFASEALPGRVFNLRALLHAGAVRLDGVAGGVWARWRGIEQVFLGALPVGEGGVVTLEAVTGQLGTLTLDDPIGELCLDLGAQGELVIAHEADADDEGARARLLPDAQAAQTLFADATGPLGMWRTTWFAPVCRALGYGIELPGATERVTRDELPDATVWRLVQVRRATAASRCAKSLAGALVVLPGAFAWDARSGEARHLAAEACARWGCSRALLTDGLRWTVHDEGRRRRVRVLDVTEACVAGAARWQEVMDLLGA